MIAELLLTIAMGGVVCVVIFMVFFNTKTVEINQKENKKRGKGKKGKNQQQKKQTQKKSNKSIQEYKECSVEQN